MKLALISILAGSAAAFAPAPAARTSVAQNAALDDLKSIAEKSNPVLKVSSMKTAVLCYVFASIQCVNKQLTRPSLVQSSSTILSNSPPQPSGETPTMKPSPSSVTPKSNTDALPWQPSSDTLSNQTESTGHSPSISTELPTPTPPDLHQNNGMHYLMRPSGKSFFSLDSWSGSLRQLVPITCVEVFQELTPNSPIIR